MEDIFSLALEHHQKRNFDEAKKLYKKLLEEQPNHLDAYNNLGIIFKNSGEYENAKFCYEKAIEINPNYPEAHNNLGIIFNNLGKYHEAKTCYEKAIEIKFNYSDAHNNLGIIFKNLGEYEKAKACYEKAIEINFQASILGREHFKNELKKNDQYYVEARKRDEKQFLIEGNDALALGCIYGGINMLSWYPITPSSSVAEAIEAYVPKLRTDKDGKATCAVIQAEDELAAVGMVLGAGWAGARGMTCTSGPGISLMSELIGLSYYSEIPGVIWDVTRVGPSTGLPTRTQQGDISMLYEASHGDTQHIVLIPGNVDECFEFGWKAFDYAEKYQTMVFGFTDLDLGMNQWVSNGFKYPDTPVNRGKVLRTKKELAKIKNYGRYRDVDGDGIPYRTLPGSGLEPILSRGTGHDEDGVYSEKADIYRDNMTRLKRKIEGARGDLPQPILKEEKELDVGIIYYGSMENTIQEIDDILESTGMKVSQCRVRALPLSLEVDEFVRRHDKVIVLEINRDGQMYGILRKEIATELVPKLYSVAFSDGLPPKAAEYAEAIIGTLESFEVS